ISIIRAGRVAESGTLQDLRHMSRTTVVATLRHPADGLADLPGVHALEVEGDQVRLDVDGDRVEPVLRTLAQLGVTSIVAHPPTLEQLLMRHYGDELRPHEDAEVA